MEHRSLIAARWAAPAAAWWCIAFAGLHLYWALGGSTGLASSAGQDLASRRPATFVVFGLYGVALTLLAGAALIVLVSIPGPMHRRSAPTALVGVIGIGLLMRGVALEILLATDVAVCERGWVRSKPAGARSSGTLGSLSAARCSSPQRSSFVGDQISVNRFSSRAVSGTGGSGRVQFFARSRGSARLPPDCRQGRRSRRSGSGPGFSVDSLVYLVLHDLVACGTVRAGFTARRRTWSRSRHAMRNRERP